MDPTEPQDRDADLTDAQLLEKIGANAYKVVGEIDLILSELNCNWLQMSIRDLVEMRSNLISKSHDFRDWLKMITVTCTGDDPWAEPVNIVPVYES